MSAVEEDWLSNEKFDFDVTASPIHDLGCLLGEDISLDLDEEDDEEVFFGPQSFKEKVAATVVKEKENLSTPIDMLKPEEQAIILRESAILSLMLKHGTPNSIGNKPSPVAVVYPMKRESLEKEFRNDIEKDSLVQNTDKENVQPSLSKTSIIPKSFKKEKTNTRIMQPKSSVKLKAAKSDTPTTSTKLPMLKARSKICSELSESVVDHATLYGLAKESTKPVRRRSGLPMKQKQRTDNNATSKVPKPSLLSSAIPPARMKGLSSSSSTSESKSKPMKATLLPSSVSKPQLMISGGRKSISSQGTPARSIRPPLVASSSACQKSSELKLSTPGKKTDLIKPQSIRRASGLITPVQSTSSRKLITSRQLAQRLPEKSSRTPSSVDSISAGEVQVMSCNIADEQDKTENIYNELKPCVGNTSVLPTHNDIINRYKKLKEIQALSNTSSSTSNDVVHQEALPPHGEISVDSELKNEENVLPEVIYQAEIGEEITPPVTASENLLLNLSPVNVSPVKNKGYSQDPFHTGRTPPPLIDITDVLLPEKTEETNLIEF